MSEAFELKPNGLTTPRVNLLGETALILQSIGHGVIVSDETGCVVLANTVAQEILGRDVIGEHFSTWVQKTGVQEVHQTTLLDCAALPLGQALAGRTPVPVEAHLPGQGGAGGAYLSISAYPILDREVVIGAVVLAQDVSLGASETKRLANLVEENARRAGELDLLLDCLTGGVIMVDVSGRVVRSNKVARRILDIDFHHFGLKDWGKEFEILDVVTRLPLPFDQSPLLKAMRGESVEAQEFVLRRAGVDREIILGAAARPVKNNGEIVGGLITFQDITAKVEAANENQRLGRELQEAQRLESIGRLAAGIAHEINTPIQYVQNNIDFIKDAAEDLIPKIGACIEALKKAYLEPLADTDFRLLIESLDNSETRFILDELLPAVAQSLEGTQRVSRIVQAMKEFSRSGAQVDLADLNRAIESTLLVTKSEWKKIAKIDLNLDPSLPQVPCNAGQINQVVANMIVNAAHAIEAVGSDYFGSIRISTSYDDENIMIDISDNGVGIPPHVMNRIYEPFFTTKAMGKGSGQGLSISHDVVVRKHHGRIDVKSESGEGTSFRITLPYAAKVADRCCNADSEVAVKG